MKWVNKAIKLLIATSNQPKWSKTFVEHLDDAKTGKL